MFDLYNSIQTKNDWLKKIDEIKNSLPNQPEITDEKTAVELVKKSILIAFEQRRPKEKFALLFSGGVDSTLLAFLAQKAGLDFVCYTSVLDDGQQIAPDLLRSQSAAEKLGLNLKIIKTDLGELEKNLPEIIKVIGRDDPIHASIAAALWPALAEVKKDGLKYFMTGLGTEQIYAGGDKYRKIPMEKINELCWEQIKEIIWDSDIARDRALEKFFDLKMLVPYLSTETIMAAMQISGELKNKMHSEYDGYGVAQKYILRAAAIALGLPPELAWRRNRPTQYGSKFDKGLERLARKNGFGNHKQEYLKSLHK